MVNTTLKEAVHRILRRVQTPGQYIGGELNSVVKDHRQVRGTLCLAFPDGRIRMVTHKDVSDSDVATALVASSRIMHA